MHSGPSHFLPSFENTLALCRSLDLAHRKTTDSSDPRDYSDHHDHGDHSTTSHHSNPRYYGDHITTSHRSNPMEFRDPRDHSNNSKPTDPDPNGLFSVTRSSSPALLQALHSAHATTGANPLAWILPSVNLSFWAEGAPCFFPPGKTDNELLGVREMSRSVDVTALIDREIGRAGDVFLRNRGDSGTGKIRDVERDRGREAMEKGRRKLVGCE